MSEAPIAPTCRHCGATCDSGSSECWLCHRRDWRTPPDPRPAHRPGGGPRSTFIGCLFAVTMTLMAMVGLAFRAGPIVGTAASILCASIFAVAIALFTICTSLAV